MDEKRNPDLPEELSPPDGETIYFTAPDEAQYFDALNDASGVDEAPEAPVTDEFPALFPDEAAQPEDELPPEDFGADTYGADGGLPPEDENLPPMYDGDATHVERPVRKKRSRARKVLRVLCVIGKFLLGLVLVVAVLAAGLIGYLTVTEYTPAYAELAERGANNLTIQLNKPTVRLVTFNTGFAGLGEDADFFMDGGTGVNPDSADVIERNMIGIERILSDLNADFLLLQEVDTDSDRSFHKNQWLQYEYDLVGYETRYAMNYSCDYVPYPLSERIGEVHSGIATYSRFDISSATRYALPCPFSWPTRVANLKRCMLVTRIPLENVEDRELVIVNFHLEAYDDGEGKAEQAAQLLDFIQAEYEKGNYVIAGGDFNQVFPGTLDTYPLTQTDDWTPSEIGELPDGWQYAYDDGVPTCRLLNQPYEPNSSKTQYYVIDGFIVSPNVTVERIETINEGFVYSDHNPVVLEVSFGE